MSVASERLENVAQVIRGVSFDKAEVSAEPITGMVPILRAGNIADVLDTGSDLIWVPPARVKQEQLLRSGDIAICMSSGSQSVVGKSAALRREWTGSVGAFCAIVRPRRERVEPAYLALYMRSERFRTWTRKSEGANIKNIRQSELLQHSVPVPPLAEQRRIVDLLSRAENIVRMRREAEATAKEVVPALFLEMFGDPARNKKHWEVATLRSLSVRGPEYGANAKSAGERLGGPRYVRITDIDDDGELRPGDRVGIAEGNWSEYELADGDIVIARSGNTVGKSLLYRTAYGPCVFAGYLIRFRPNRERVQPEYVGVALRTEYFKTWVASHRRAAGQPNINGQEYAGLVLPVPPLDLQIEFARQVQNVRAMFGSQRVALNTSDRAFESLLAGVFREDGQQ